MTQDEIIEMAAEIWNAGSEFPIPSSDDIILFASKVVETERKECAEQYLRIMRNAVKDAVDSEREACAKVCEDKVTLLAWATFAQAIRARGNNK